MKKKPPCGLELLEPQIGEVHCPACGLVFGRGGDLNVRDPCFSTAWDKREDYVFVKGARIDNVGALCPRTLYPNKCEDCPRNRRAKIRPWES